MTSDGIPAIYHPASLRDQIKPRHATPPDCVRCGKKCNRWADAKRPVCCSCEREDNRNG